MPDQREQYRRRLSRRRALQVGIGGTAGLALHGRLRTSQAYSSPIASPAPEAGYANPEMLVDADRVTEVRRDEEGILVGFMPEEEFGDAHIPGSVQLDWPVLEVTDTSDSSIKSWREETSRTLALLGITQDRPVLAYDAGTLFAARLWWVLHYLGHEDKHVLNGGVAAWQQSGGEISADATPVAQQPSPAHVSFQVQPQADVLAQIGEVRTSFDDPNVVIVDARTPDEYAAGHIPGAVNINARAMRPTRRPRYGSPVTSYERCTKTLV